MKKAPFHYLVAYDASMNRALLNKVMDLLKAKYPESMLILVGKDGVTFPIGSYVGSSLRTTTRTAAIITKTIAQAKQGSGGGKPDLAFGAGKTLIDLGTIIQPWLQ